MTQLTYVWKKSLDDNPNLSTIHDKQESWIEACPPELILKVFEYLSPEHLGKICCVSRQWNDLASTPFLWKSFIRNLSTIRNLDEYDLKSRGFPQVSSSIVHPKELFAAAKNACQASENGKVTILTIPAGWSFEDLKSLSKKAVDAGISSARLWYNGESQAVLVPIKEEQTVVLTDTVIHNSREKSAESQKQYLESKGFKKGLPNALTVLTIAILIHIVTDGQATIYHMISEPTYTRCAEKINETQHLRVGSLSPAGIPVGISVEIDDDSNQRFIGVGGLQKFVKTL
jgi:hypothetical protein